MAASHSNLRTRIHGEHDALILTPLARRLRSRELVELVGQLAAMLHQCQEHTIIINFAHVRRLSFAACAFLVQMERLAAQTGHELSVRNPPARLRSKMMLYHIEELIDEHRQTELKVPASQE